MWAHTCVDRGSHTSAQLWASSVSVAPPFRTKAARSRMYVCVCECASANDGARRLAAHRRLFRSLAGCSAFARCRSSSLSPARQLSMVSWCALGGNCGCHAATAGATRRSQTNRADYALGWKNKDVAQVHMCLCAWQTRIRHVCVLWRCDSLEVSRGFDNIFSN